MRSLNRQCASGAIGWLLLLPGVAFAEQPLPGWPWSVTVHYFPFVGVPATSGGSATTQPVAEVAVLYKLDDANLDAYTGVLPNGNEAALILTPVEGSPELRWVTGEDGVGNYTPSGVVVSGMTLVGAVLRCFDESGVSHVTTLQVVAADYGSTWDVHGAGKMFASGMGIGVVVDFVVMLLAFAFRGFRREVNAIAFGEA